MSTLWGDLMYCSDTRIWREENDAAEIERALYSLKYGEIYKEIKYGDL